MVVGPKTHAAYDRPKLDGIPWASSLCVSRPTPVRGTEFYKGESNGIITAVVKSSGVL
jgi:hypothetical protein